MAKPSGLFSIPDKENKGFILCDLSRSIIINIIQATDNSASVL